MTQDQQFGLASVRCALQSRRKDLTGRELHVTHDRTRDDETLQAIHHATANELAEIEEALQRMEDGLYGICRDCGQPIAPLRLTVLPQVVTCAACTQ